MTMMKNSVASRLYGFVTGFSVMVLLWPAILRADSPSASPPSFSYKVLSDTDIVIEPSSRYEIVKAILEDFTECISYGTQKLTYSCTADEKSGKALTYSRQDLRSEASDHGFIRLRFP